MCYPKAIDYAFQDIYYGCKKSECLENNMFVFQILWDEKTEKMSVVIKPVETQLSDVNVEGCRPPWYLWYVFI